MYVEIETLSGVVLKVLPCAPMLQAQLWRKEMDKDPFDETPFMQKAAGNSVDKQREKVNRISPEYQAAFKEYENKITQRVNNRMYDTLVIPISHDKDELIARSKDELPVYRDLIDDDEVSDWRVVVDYLLVTQRDERQALVNAIGGQKPVTDEELSDALATFRYVSRRLRPVKPRGDKGSPESGGVDNNAG